MKIFEMVRRAIVRMERVVLSVSVVERVPEKLCRRFEGNSQSTPVAAAHTDPAEGPAKHAQENE
jgi:hypothetical protein